jgi:hypothetical protein
MKQLRTYWVTTFVSFALSAGVAAVFTPVESIPKFPLPDMRRVFISSYGDRDAVHRLFYFGLFGFDRRIANADMLIMGNSHAELGLSAERIGAAFSTPQKPYRVMNLGIGWGEGFPFDKELLKRQHLRNKSILLELYAMLVDRYSVVGGPILAEARFAAWVRVVETWASTFNDWTLDGILPRISYVNQRFVVGRFLAYPVGLRLLETGDVFDYWIPNWGEVYRVTPQKLISRPDPPVPVPLTGDYLAQSRYVLDADMMRANRLTVLTTLMPSSEIHQPDSRSLADALHVPFLPIAFGDITLYDGYHANADGRNRATEHLVEELRTLGIMPKEDSR